MGQDGAARRVMDEFKSARGVGLPQLAGPYAAVAMPARAALERGDWAAASQLPIAHTAFPFCDAITAFARTLGAARLGDAAAAEKEAQPLAVQHQALLDAKNNYWATEVEVQRVASSAWIAHARGQNEEALRLMRAAADLEDRNEKHIVTPGRIVPARELLGEMLLELKQPAAALKEFEQSQLREPNRLRGYAGAAAAAEAAGLADKARTQYGRLIELTRVADTPLAVVAHAKTYLETR
jgi:tetratricopeptide (TPR) repeat protein